MYTYLDSQLSRPYPPHVLTDAAEWGRERVAAYAVERIAKRTRMNAELVTSHLEPWHQVELIDLTGAAALFAKAALAAGHEVAARAAGSTVCVGVRAPHVRAYWHEGRSSGVLLDGHKATVATAKAVLFAVTS